MDKFLDSNFILFIIFLFVVIGIFIVLTMFKSYLEYRQYAKYLKLEIKRATSASEYMRWKNELINLRLSILPGLNPDRVKRFRKFLAGGKHYRSDDMNYNALKSILLPLFIGMSVCCLCIGGGTYAWFTASNSIPTKNIQAAEYTVDITVIDINNNNVLTPVKGSYILNNSKYRVKLVATGNASTGFCVIKADDSESLHTSQFPLNGGSNIFEFTVEAKGNTDIKMEIVPQWGTSVKNENPDISSTVNNIVFGKSSQSVDKKPVTAAPIDSTTTLTSSSESVATEIITESVVSETSSAIVSDSSLTESDSEQDISSVVSSNVSSTDVVSE